MLDATFAALFALVQNPIVSTFTFCYAVLTFGVPRAWKQFTSAAFAVAEFRKEYRRRTREDAQPFVNSP